MSSDMTLLLDNIRVRIRVCLVNKYHLVFRVIWNLLQNVGV